MEKEKDVLSIRINGWYILPRFTLVVFLNVGIYTINVWTQCIYVFIYIYMWL